MLQKYDLICLFVFSEDFNRLDLVDLSICLLRTLTDIAISHSRASDGCKYRTLSHSWTFKSLLHSARCLQMMKKRKRKET